MNILLLLIPAALLLGFLGLAAFIWALKNGQFSDLEGASVRILMDDPAAKPEARPEDASEDQSERSTAPKTSL